jgi:hypothetical protein
MQFDPICRVAPFLWERLNHAVQRSDQAGCSPQENTHQPESTRLVRVSNIVPGTHVPGTSKLPKANFDGIVITNIMQHLSLFY